MPGTNGETVPLPGRASLNGLRGGSVTAEGVPVHPRCPMLGMGGPLRISAMPKAKVRSGGDSVQLPQQVCRDHIGVDLRRKHASG